MPMRSEPRLELVVAKTESQFDRVTEHRIDRVALSRRRARNIAAVLTLTGLTWLDRSSSRRLICGMTGLIRKIPSAEKEAMDSIIGLSVKSVRGSSRGQGIQ
ncbi:hypothetical protein SDJN02_03651 [Cucurbita argyrosperma subsp. argyrosperma]|nr:hypothetical protein SDJN02_03651 [Cucurbita argyrosperma subsp. argyrosperma]